VFISTRISNSDGLCIPLSGGRSVSEAAIHVAQVMMARAAGGEEEEEARALPALEYAAHADEAWFRSWKPVCTAPLAVAWLQARSTDCDGCRAGGVLCALHLCVCGYWLVSGLRRGMRKASSSSGGA
jgi:hypothetical protein